MASQLQDTVLEEIPWDSLTPDQLRDIADNDDRVTAQDKAKALLEERLNPAPVPTLEEYDPRQDPGPERLEDIAAREADETPTSDTEVPLEDSRKDDTTILASDQYDAEGNRVI